MMMKKTVSLVVSLLLLVSVMGGCASPKTPEKVNVYAIKGPSGVGMVQLMEQQEKKATKNEYHFSTMASPNEAVAKVSNKEADIAAVPTNMAAMLFNKTGGDVQMLAINTLGVLYLLENGNTVQQLSDLKGKTIYTTGQGANPEYVLRYILSKNNLENDVTIQFVSENEELAALMAAGTAKIAMVPEPTVTSIQAKTSTVRVAFSMNDEWNKVGNGSSLMMGCVIVRTAFAKEHPQAVKDFLTEYKASVENVMKDIDGTAALCEKFGIIPKAAVAKKAIPGCNVKYVAGEDMRTQIGGYFDVLYAANPQSIGGKLPGETFYYMG